MQDIFKELSAFAENFTPTFDGCIHRFPRNGKQLVGWFVGHEFDLPGGKAYSANYGDWSTGETHTLKSTVSESDAEAFAAAIKAAQIKESEEKEDRQAQAAADCAALFALLPLADTNEYCTKKGITPAYAHSDPLGNLVLPIITPHTRTITSAQIIEPNGSKRLWPGGKIAGSIIVCGEAQTSTLIICEGYATGRSAHQIGGHTTWACINTNGLKSFAHTYSGTYKKIIIASDNDHLTEGNPGHAAAVHTAKVLTDRGFEVEIKLVPAGPGVTDWNDYVAAQGIEAATSAWSQELLVRGLNLEPLERKLTAKGKEIPPTEQELATALAVHHAGQYIREGSEVFEWLGTHWRETHPKEFKYKSKRELQILAGNDAPNSTLNAAFELFMGLLPCPPYGQSLFVQAPNVCNFKDGTLHVLTTGNRNRPYEKRFLPHSKKDLITWVLPYEYQAPRTPNPLWDSFLDRLFPPSADRAEKIYALQEVGGACLVAMFPQIVFFFSETAQSGKSTFAKLCGAFVGDNNAAYLPPEEMRGFAMETLIGKRVNICTDITGGHIDSGTLLRNEDNGPAFINRKNRQAIHATLPNLHLFCGNKLPSGIDGSTQALDRRVTIIRMDNKVDDSEKVREFQKYVLAAGPGAVLDFFERGLDRLLNQGGSFSRPAETKEMVETWRVENSQVKRFFLDISRGNIGAKGAELYLHCDASIRQKDLSEAFFSWLKEGGELPRVTRFSLYREVRQMGYQTKTVRGCDYFQGIGIRGQGEGANF